MSEYNFLNIETDNLLLIVTSTFDFGDPRSGKVRILYKDIINLIDSVITSFCVTKYNFYLFLTFRIASYLVFIK
jgi:hypothetical protein